MTPRKNAARDPGRTEGMREQQDAEPHRGGLLFVFATAPSLSGVLFLLLVIPFTTTSLPYARDLAFLVALLLSSAGFGLSLTTLLMAREDLRKIQAGLMDPSGKALTSEAKSMTFSGLLVNLALFLFSAVVVAIRLTQ